MSACAIEVSESRVSVRAPFALKDRLKAIPGARWNPASKAWTYPATAAVAERLRPFLGDRDELPDAFRELLISADSVASAQRFKDKALDLAPLPFVPVTQPWRHQLAAYHFAAELPACLLFLGMGCLVGDSIINVNRNGKGFRMRLDALVEREIKGWPKQSPTFVRGLLSDGSTGLTRLLGVKVTGERATILIRLNNGCSVRLTPAHEVVTPDGKVRADSLGVGDAVLTDRIGGRSYLGERKNRPYLACRLPDGRRLSRDGYVIVAQGRKKGSTILEHRVVMSGILGRDLREDEVIHHRNGDRTDNRPENLDLLSQSEHAALHRCRGNLAGTAPAVARVVEVVADMKVLPVYDLSVEDEAHTYTANGIVVGNTGKTRITLDLIQGAGHKVTLVIAPLSVLPAWQKQAQLHAPGVRVVALSDGLLSRRTAIAEREVRTATQPLILAINYEAAWREPFASFALELGADLVVADECHRIKAPGSRVSMFFDRLGRAAKRRLGLSGTPLAHSPLDAYGIFRFLDPGIFGTSFNRFSRQFAVFGGFQDRQVLSYVNTEEFNRRFYSITFRADRDVLDLPEVSHIERTFTLPPAAARVYRELRDQFVSWVGDSEVTATNALPRLLRLQQITSGHLPVGEGETAHVERLHTEKRQLLTEVLEEIEPTEPVVVFARFREDLVDIHAAAAAAGRTSSELSGSRRELAAWQAGQTNVLAVQIQAGSEGVDFTRARYAGYYSLGFSLSQFDQSLARIHRPGQTRPCVYFHLIAEQSVDRVVYKALRDRKEVITTILEEKSL